MPQEESNLLYRPSHCPTCGVKIKGGRPGNPMRALPCECPINSLMVFYLDAQTADDIREVHEANMELSRHVESLAGSMAQLKQSILGAVELFDDDPGSADLRAAIRAVLEADRG